MYRIIINIINDGEDLKGLSIKTLDVDCIHLLKASYALELAIEKNTVKRVMPKISPNGVELDSFMLIVEICDFKIIFELTFNRQYNILSVFYRDVCIIDKSYSLDCGDGVDLEEMLSDAYRLSLKNHFFCKKDKSEVEDLISLGKEIWEDFLI